MLMLLYGLCWAPGGDEQNLTGMYAGYGLFTSVVNVMWALRLSATEQYFSNESLAAFCSSSPVRSGEVIQ